jgi:ACS family glucarate transporter-like MFS transporter
LEVFAVTRLLAGRLRWALILFTFLISSLAYLDRVNISIAASSIQKEYALSNIQLGWVFSAFVLGYALFQAPGGRVADKFGPRVVIALAILWWSIFTLFTAIVPVAMAGAVALLIAVRFSLGIGEAVMFPASNRLVAKWIPSSERGLANGLIFAGVGAGSAVAPPLITWILLNWGWRWAFYVRVPIGILAALLWYWLVRDTPQAHPWTSKKEADTIQAGLPKPAAATAAQTKLSWGSILGNRSMAALTISYFAFGYVAWIFFTWFFTYLSKVRGLDLKSSSFFSMLPFIAMAGCSMFGGFVADILTKRYGKRVGRCGVAGIGIGLSAIFIAMATQVESAQFASIVLASGAGALYLSQSAFWAVTADIAGGSVGSASGLMNMGCQLGGALTASLTPWIADNFGWTPSFLVAAGLCVIGAIAWAVVDPNTQIGDKPAETRAAAN